MVILIAGDTHTGKTLLAQRLMERYKFPYLSIDHLKMGLIRSGSCTLPADGADSELTAYLWPVVREMIKTVIENGQNLIIEGCYIPFGWDDDFTDDYKRHIRYTCLIFSREYLNAHFTELVKHENAIELRKSSDICFNDVCTVNSNNLQQCIARGYNYVLIEGDGYKVELGDVV